MLPSWEDSNLGTMKRAALWLVAEVGEGNEFTKESLREAFPGVSQIDRRMRDLRDYGWRIDTNREDLTLSASEQRFVTMGKPVWEGGLAMKTTAIGAVRRREVISADSNMCRSCGITPGQMYPDTYEAAQLDIARREVQLPDGTIEVQLVTECNRCRVGGKNTAADAGAVVRQVARLGALERKVFAGWVRTDEREFSSIERLWGEYRALPADARAAVRAELGFS